MKRILSTGLLFFYLISFTEFSEVLRLPLLVQHYIEHKGQVADLSFFEFLGMHYKNDVAHDDQDMSLPFKDCHHSFSGQTVMLPLHKIALDDRSQTISNAYASFYLLHEPQLRAGDIFQPPKL